MTQPAGAGALRTAGDPAGQGHARVGMGCGRGSPPGQIPPSVDLVLDVLLSVCVFKAEDKTGAEGGKKSQQVEK